MHENQIAAVVVDAAYHVHKKLGPGLLESVYEVTLAHELRKRGLRVDRQVPVAIHYDDLVFEEGFRADLIIENKFIVELKAVETMPTVAPKQLLTYLRLRDCRLGLLINFNEAQIKNGITRIVNGLEELESSAS
jgi:GxxExxY protein